MSIINEKYATDILFLLKLDSKPQRDRSDSEKEHHEKLLYDLERNFTEIINDVYGKQILELLNPDNLKRVLHMREWLESDALTPPHIPVNKHISDVEINESILPKLNESTNSVLGALEWLGKLDYQLSSIIDKISGAIGLIFNCDKKWKIDGIIDLILSPALLGLLRDVTEVLNGYKNRKEQLDKSYTIISRIISSRASTNPNPLLRLEQQK